MIRQFLSRLFRPAAVEPAPAAVTKPKPEGAATGASPAARGAHPYELQLSLMLDDAMQNRTIVELVDALSCTLAKILLVYGDVVVAGDILRRLGLKIYEVSERLAAEREAEQARKEGRKPH